jgi:hypothetical protein
MMMMMMCILFYFILLLRAIITDRHFEKRYSRQNRPHRLRNNYAHHRGGGAPCSLSFCVRRALIVVVRTDSECVPIPT